LYYIVHKCQERSAQSAANPPVSANGRATSSASPAPLSFAEAAGLPLAGLTAFQTVAHVLDVQPGEILLVHGAAGGVGSLAVQIASSRSTRH
jgi:NADPH:quinone reductase-like Zn-dependent oxidoreductase